MITIIGGDESLIAQSIKDTPWRASFGDGVCTLECELYDDRYGYPQEFYWSPEKAREAMEDLIGGLPAGTRVNGSCEFEAFGNWDADHPEDMFGVIAIEGREVALRYGIRIYDPNMLQEGLCHSKSS